MMDVDATLPMQINRKLFLKQYSICPSEWKILFPAQYVRICLLYFCNLINLISIA